MSHLRTLDRSAAGPEAASLLAEVEKKFGFVPNLMGVLANSPEALKAYLTLSELVGKTTFSAEEQQTILLAVSLENQCEYCVAAHSMVAAKMAGMPETRLAAIRDKRPTDNTRLNALVEFTQEVVRAKGFINDGSVDQFFKAGFNSQNLLEVLLCVSMKTLSNYTNHIAHTALDKPFTEFAWSKKQ